MGPLVSRRKGSGPGAPLQRSSRPAARKSQSALGLVLALSLGLTACADEPQGVIDVQYQFSGAVLASEPQAATAARELILQGGSAADAVVAAAFAMTATLPSRVGVMGGGSCVVFDGGAQVGDSIGFPAKRAGSGGMVPGFVLGLETLHSRYGRLRWPQLVAVGEKLARFGGKTSRAFARDAAQARDLLAGDPKMAEVFLGADGQPPREGEPAPQIELAAVLGQIRQQGFSILYRSRFSEALAATSVTLGQPFTAQDLRDYRPDTQLAASVPFERLSAYFAPPPIAGGIEGAQLTYLLGEEEPLTSEAGLNRLHLFAEASQNVYMASAGWRGQTGISYPDLLQEGRMAGLLAGYSEARHNRPAGGSALLAPGGEEPGEPATASVVALDYLGQVVACNFSMGRLFGSGRMTPQSGLLLAAPESGGGKLLSPVIVADDDTGAFYFAGTASGGDAGQQNLVRALVEVFDKEGGLRQTLSEARIAHNGYPDVVWAERNLPAEQRRGLESRGHKVEVAPAIGEVHAIYCPEALRAPQLCEVAVDPRSFALPLRAD